MLEQYKITRALLSVADKTGIVELAEQLVACQVEIISSGGTYKVLSEANIPVKKVSEITAFPEIMDGRVKTLHPKIHGGILGRRNQDQGDAAAHDIPWIDMVVCNLYPFAKTVARGQGHDACVEQIDIGGPAMIRAAAKNHQWITVVHDPADYTTVGAALAQGGTTVHLRKQLAAKAFAHTAQYDALIAEYLNEEPLAADHTVPLVKVTDCRYGENPHQQAAVYRNVIDHDQGLFAATTLQGKALSFNNWHDASAALQTLRQFDVARAACVIVKHANPCGVAVGDDVMAALNAAWQADSKSAFGGIVALNQVCTAEVADFLSSVFVEVIIAPDYTRDALAVFASKPNLRLLKLPITSAFDSHCYKYIPGGLLRQQTDLGLLQVDDLECVTATKVTPEQLTAMTFAWPVLKQLKSNAIVIANTSTTLGLGMGQVSRIDAVEQAIGRAPADLSDAILASDAFFPFPDSIERIAKTAIKAIVQPGGSVKDQEVIAACDRHGIAMAFTGKRCFNH